MTVSRIVKALWFSSLAAWGAYASALSSGNATTPVEKVVSLLEDLRTQIQSDGRAEAAAYDTFACFCKDATATKSGSITTAHDQIDTLSADIQAATASQTEKSGDLMDRKAEQERFSAELKETQGRCLKEAADFEAKVADLRKAVSSLDAAVKALDASKPVLLETREAVAQTIAVAEAMSLIKTPEQRAVQAFLQQGVDPAEPDYVYHSQGIIDTLRRLLTEFTDNKIEAESERDKASKACRDEKKGLADSMSANDAAIASLTRDIDGLKVSIATDRESLVQTKSLLTDSQVYLKDVTERCEARAKDWDQRSALRASELKALSQALSILTGQVQSLDAAVNVRAGMLLQHGRRGGLASLAENSEASAPAAVGAAHARGGRLALISLHRATREQRRSATLHREQGSMRKETRDGERLSVRSSRALDLLARESARLGSPVLSAIAESVAADPFAKVKQLIQGLIERLLKEATSEATKKGYCDTEVGKATQSRDMRYADVQKLVAELVSLKAKQGSLTESIALLSDSANTTSVELDKATAERAQSKAANIDTTAKAKEGLSAVTEAISILKAFYKDAAKATSLLQESPVELDDPGAGFQGAYAGRQGESKGIVGLLEVIKSDFERTIRATDSEEKRSAADFVDFDRVSKVSIAENLKAKALNEEELQSTEDAITRGMADIQSAQDMLDSSLKTIEDLKPMCIDNTMSFSERAQKRDEEIAALKQALCYLDPDKVEDACATASPPAGR